MTNATPHDTAYHALVLMCDVLDTDADGDGMLDALDRAATFHEMTRSELGAAVDALTDLFADVCVAIRRETGSTALVRQALLDGGFRSWYPSHTA